MAAKTSTKKGSKRSRRAPYEGGSWSVGACAPHPKPTSAIEAAQRAQTVRAHYLPFAEARYAETGRAIYQGIADFYRAELSSLDDMIARGTRGSQKRTARKRAA